MAFPLFKKQNDTIAWNEKTKNKLDSMIARTPLLFRKSAEKSVTDTAFSLCQKRKGDYISDDDLIQGFLLNTPDLFKGPMIKNAIDLGLPVEKFLSRERLRKMQALSKSMVWQDIEAVFHPDVTWFEWAVTGKCNLRCIYCYEESDSTLDHILSTGEAQQIIKSLGASGKELNRKFVMLWSGGEPLMRRDIFDLIRYAGEQGMLSTMATNGTLIDKKKARGLKDAGVSIVIITIDSMTESIHNALRGKGSWQKAREGAYHCKNAGILTMIESVATNRNWREIGKLKKWADKEGFLYFYRPLHRGGRASDDSLLMTPEHYKKVYFERNAHLFSKLNKGKGTEIPLFEIFDMVPFAHTPRSEEEKSHLEWGAGCQACRLLHGISTRGELLPCIRLKKSLGNLLTESFSEIIETPFYQQITNRQRRGGICEKCEHLELCGGGCLAETYVLKGDPFAGWDRCEWLYPGKRGSVFFICV